MQFSIFLSFGYVFYICISSIALLGQNLNRLNFESYTTDEGLPLNETQHLAIDGRGFLWVSTINGISKFDGQNFKNYTSNVHNSVVLEETESMTVDSIGRVWVKGKDSLFIYDEKLDAFIAPTINIYDRTGSIGQIFHDKKHTLWLACEKGLFKLNTQNYYFEASSFNKMGILRFAQDTSGRLWISHIQNKVSRYDPVQDSFYTWKLPFPAVSMYPYKEDKLWISTRGMALLDLKSGTTELFHPEFESDLNPDGFVLSEGVVCPLITGDSILWLTSYVQGLFVFNMKAKKFVNNYVTTPSDIKTIPSNCLWRLVWSPQGILWISSVKNGLIKLDFNNQHSFETQLPFKEKEITAIIKSKESQNELYIGTLNGKLYRYRLNENTISASWKIGTKSTNSEYSIECLYEDELGKLWIGAGNGLYVLENDRIVNKRLDFPLESYNYVRQILPEADGESAWLLTGQGLCNYNFISGGYTFYPLNIELNLRITPYPLKRMSKTADGIFWIATAKGLYRFDPATGNIKKIDIRTKEGPSIEIFQDINRSPEGKIWLCSISGVLVFDHENETVEQISSGRGVDFPIQFIDQPNGEKYLFSSSGLLIYNQRTREFLPTSLEKGVSPWITRGDIRGLHEIGDHFLLADEGKLLIFNPAKIDFNPNPARPIIEELKIRGFAFPFDKDLVADQGLKLSHDQNFISFDFTGLNFTQSDRMQFQYILEGFEEDWVVANKGRSVSYTNLEPGSYTFKVLAANSAGIWDPQPAVFKFRILPPFWETWWFRILAICTLIGTGYLIAQNQIRKIRQRAEIREREAGYKQREAELKQEVAEFSKQVAEVELAALRAQMNPHFVFNCLNSINTFILLNDPRNASLYLQKFSKLIRQVLDASRSEYISLKNELDTLRYYIELEQMRYGGKFAYIIEVNETIQQDVIDLPPMLVQPYVENAIWHGLMHKDGEGGLLRIDIDRELQNLQITIEDNGIGRKKAAEMKSKSAVMHKSHGMAVTDERIKIINDLYGTAATVKIEDLYNNLGEATGTRVTLILPLKGAADESHYA